MFPLAENDSQFHGPLKKSKETRKAIAAKHLFTYDHNNNSFSEKKHPLNSWLSLKRWLIDYT